MSEITRAEFNAFMQKVEEIHRMLQNMGGQPNVVMVQPYPVPPFIVTYGGGGGGGGGGGSKHQNLGGGAEPKWMAHQSNATAIRAPGEKE